VSDSSDVFAGDEPAEAGRAVRLGAQRRGWRRRAALGAAVGALIAGGGVAAYALVDTNGTASRFVGGGLAAAAPLTTEPAPPTTKKPKPTTTTTTVPPVRQPKAKSMPDPGGSLGVGSAGPVVAFYEARMQELKLDPGPVDGVYDQRTAYAVSAVQKYYNQPRTGRIDAGAQQALANWKWSPAEPKSEADRVEIDLDRQTLTLFWSGQPVLLTSTSTGSGEHFCGGVDGCQYAITPTGRFEFYFLHRGWQKGKLGQMWNPYYFNGSIAVHGLASVPNEPASHGCARIPMHVADYFYTLVRDGMPVFVVGTQKQAGDGYVGPTNNRPRTPATPPPIVFPSIPPATTAPPVTAPPTTKKPTPTTAKPTVTTAAPSPTTPDP
jgi:hypothetical protein